MTFKLYATSNGAHQICFRCALGVLGIQQRAHKSVVGIAAALYAFYLSRLLCFVDNIQSYPCFLIQPESQCQNSGFFHTHTENRYSPSNWAATGTGTTFRKFLQPCFAQYPTFRRCLMAAYTALRDTVAFSPRTERFALALQRVDVAKEFR